jgi:MFS family permease
VLACILGKFMKCAMDCSGTINILIFCSALTYVSAFTTNSEAALYNALTGLSWGIGAILGPVIGGAFSDSSATWRWVS